MENPALAALIAAILAGGCHLALVGTLLRATSGKQAPTIIFGIAALLVAMVPMFAGSLLSFWHFAAFFGAIVALVVFLYGAVLKSLSLAMLVELSQAHAHQLSLDELADRVVRPAFEKRARLLVDAGAAVPGGPGYMISAKGTISARRIRAIRQFFRLQSLGLYGS